MLHQKHHQAIQAYQLRMKHLRAARKQLDLQEEKALEDLVKVLEEDDNPKQGKGSTLASLQRFFHPYGKGYCPA